MPPRKAKAAVTTDKATRRLLKAQAQLQQRALEYSEAIALQSALQRQLHLLESTSQDKASVASLAQRLQQQLTMHARPMQRVPSTYPCGVLETSCNVVRLAALPMRLEDYSMELVRRVADMTMGDATQIYKEFQHVRSSGHGC
jgi:hypothetical protein